MGLVSVSLSTGRLREGSPTPTNFLEVRSFSTLGRAVDAGHSFNTDSSKCPKHFGQQVSFHILDAVELTYNSTLT